MAHELELAEDGTASFAYRESKGPAWHKLGFPVGDNMTPEEMMVAARADFEVAKVNTFAEIVLPNGETKMSPTGRKALIRTDTGKILTEVGKGWNPVQNSEAFEFFADFVSHGDMIMDTAGVLKGGQIVWALADVKEGFEVQKGDAVRGYLLFCNPHRYGQTIDIKFVMERVVCNNTLSVALNEKGQPSVRVNHRAKFDAEKVKEILGLGHTRIERFEEAAKHLASKQYTAEIVDLFMGKVFGRDSEGNLTRTATQATAILETQPGAELAPGSMWNVFNSVTYMTDHVLGRTDATRFESAIWGGNARKKLQALDVALKLAA